MILIPVGTAMIIVADVKYARVSTSIPTVNMWCAHTTNPSSPIASIAKIIPRCVCVTIPHTIQLQALSWYFWSYLPRATPTPGLRTRHECKGSFQCY
jgi:hypothetical protein